MRKVLAIIITVLLVIALLPGIALAVNTSDASGNVYLDQPIAAGTLQATIEALPDISAATDVTTLTITSTGALNSTDIAYINTMTNMTALNVASTMTVGDAGDNFLSGHSNIVSVVFPATTFGNFTLNGCGALTSVRLPEAASFGVAAFNPCLKLKVVDLPKAVTFGDSAFAACI